MAADVIPADSVVLLRPTICGNLKPVGAVLVDKPVSSITSLPENLCTLNQNGRLMPI